MRIKVRHRTEYLYDAPISYAIQTLRLAPQAYEGQKVLEWRVTGEDDHELPSYIDGYGNIVHSHSVNRLHKGAAISVEGLVETSDQHGVVRGAPEPLPTSYYLRSTPLTEESASLIELAKSAQGEGLDRAHDLMVRVREAVDYKVGETEVHTTADEALKSGLGVCQDHAHVMISCMRSLAVPARYVSGYLWTGQEEEFEASHAWMECFIEGLGWVGFDPANKVCPTDQYIRIAIGLDYWSAAPIRGIRHGVAEERLAVSVQVHQDAQQ